METCDGNWDFNYFREIERDTFHAFLLPCSCVELSLDQFQTKKKTGPLTLVNSRRSFRLVQIPTKPLPRPGCYREHFLREGPAH